MLGTSIAYRNFLITLFLHFHFISAVHIRFISYIINSHFFSREHMIPQLTCPQRQLLHNSVGRASHRYREVTGSNPVEVLIFFFQASLRNCINCVHCDGHFFIFISFPQFIYDLFHILGVPSGKCQRGEFVYLLWSEPIQIFFHNFRGLKWIWI